MKQIIFSAAILLAAAGCSCTLPEDELSATRDKLAHYMQHDAATQSEMSIMSDYMLQLANMEKYLIEYRIWNQDGYEKIEKAFREDCAEWEKLAEKEAKTPSEFQGGSLAPCDHNLRMTGFIQERIDELKAKWLNKK